MTTVPLLAVPAVLAAELLAIDQRLLVLCTRELPVPALLDVVHARDYLDPLLPGELPSDEVCAEAERGSILEGLRDAERRLDVARTEAPLLQMTPIALAMHLVGLARQRVSAAEAPAG